MKEGVDVVGRRGRKEEVKFQWRGYNITSLETAITNCIKTIILINLKGEAYKINTSKVNR